jgi:hypothetical protein
MVIFSKKLIYTGRSSLPEIQIQQPVEFPTTVTHKLLTVWSRLMDHRKAERVAYQFGIRDLRSFSRSESQKLNPDQLLFCPETKISSDVSRQNSVTPKPLSERSHMNNG